MLENDVKVVVFVEVYFGVVWGSESSIYVIVSIGIGVGLVLYGWLWCG